MTRTPLIVGSHKVFLGVREAVCLAHGLVRARGHGGGRTRIVLAPSIVNLAHVSEAVRGSDIALAAQNVHQDCRGAFTGQVCLEELLPLDVGFVILGHQEVIESHGESAALIAAKVRWCLDRGVRPIVCVRHGAGVGSGSVGGSGSGDQVDSLIDTLDALFRGVEISSSHATMPLVAYEPARAGDRGERSAHAAVALIRSHLRARWGSAAGPEVLYGGGVTPGTAASLVRDLDVDGLMVGRASVEAGSFLAIIDAVERLVADQAEAPDAAERSRAGAHDGVLRLGVRGA
jgi:triosephosphate isomerase (TIM)